MNNAEHAARDLDGLRTRLIDLTRRSRLIHLPLGARAVAIRLVATPLRPVLARLLAGEGLPLAPLPEPDDEIPREERTPKFESLLAEAKAGDAEYQTALAEAAASGAEETERLARIEHRLRNEVRAKLGWPPRPFRPKPDPVAIARQHGINPAYDLAEEGVAVERLQTLLLPEDLEEKAEALRRRARAAAEERGIEILKLAIGALEWPDGAEADKVNLSPLLLLPVALERRVKARSRTPEYVLRAEAEAPEANAALALRLEQDFRIILPPLGVEEDETDPWAPIGRHLAALRQVAKGQRGWRVHTWLTLAPLSFARLAMWRDLDPALWPDGAPAGHPLVFPLLRAPATAEPVAAAPIEVERPEHASLAPHLVLDADSSQHAAIIEAMRGRSFVIEGPPGTGKSQTIVNLIANAVAAGKRVLFVAEKRAALEVVHNRLAGLDLDAFALPLHGAEATPQAVLQHLRRRLACRPGRAPPPATGADDDRALLARHVAAVNAAIGPRGETAVDLIGTILLTAPAEEDRRAVLREASEAMPADITAADLARGERLMDALEAAAAALRQSGTEPQASPFAALGRADLLPDEAEDLLAAVASVTERARAAAAAAAAFLAAVHCDDVPTVPARLRDLAGRLLALGAPPPSLAALPAGSLATPGQVQRADELVALAVAAAAAADRLRAAGLAAGLDPAALRALEADAAAAGAPATLALGEVPAFAERAQIEADRVEALAQRARSAAALLGLPTALRQEEVQRLVQVAEAAAALEPAAIAARRPGLEAEAQALAQAAKHARDLARRSRHLDGQIDWEGCDEAQAAALRHAAATFCRWSLFTGWTRAGRQARAVLHRHWQAAATPPRGVAAAVVLEEAAVLIEEVQKLLAGDVVRRHQPGAQRLADLALDGLAAAAAWQAGLRARLGGSADLADRLVALPAERFRALAEALPDLRALAELLASSGGSAANLEDHCRGVRATAEAATRLRQGLAALGLPWALTVADLAPLRQALDRLRAAEAAAADPLWQALFGSGRGPAELAAAEAAVAYARRLHETVPEAARLLAGPAAWPEVEQTRRALETALDSYDAARARLAACGAASLLPADDRPLAETISTGTALLAQQALFAPTIDWLGRLAEAEALPLTAPLARLLRDGRLAPCDLRSALAWCAARRCLRAHAEAHREVFRRTGAELDQARERFRRADRLRIETAAEAVRRRLLELRPPAGSTAGRKRDWTEMALINNELTKKRGFVRLRRLFDQAFGAITTLTPCVMMSPLTVAEILPARYGLFDLVVMDEASQIRPEEAVGALLRARQAVIVGDPQQLPPTPFFDRLVEPEGAGSEDEEANDPIVAESVLDLAERAFAPPRRLLWHYRSRHESLIAFSNRHFYDDSLIVFPAPAQPGEELGVELRQVDGVWRGGENNRVNVEEARAVVEAVAALVRRAPDRSIGVVAMNQPQRGLIERELELRARSDAALAEYLRQWEERTDPREPLFVKNLENVQGDERDVILVSLGYGRTPEGVLHQRFFPIQRAADGHRRLNVLFTRARSKLVVFASIKPEEIQAEGRARGVQVLRDYLLYAREGRLEAGGVSAAAASESPFEEAVRRVLVGRGYEVACQVGVQGYRIDLAVRHPEDRTRFVLGIECDGATYHSAKSTRDRDRLRQEAVERLGWRIHRVWSTDWWRDPRAAADRLLQAVAQAIAEAKPAGARPAAVPAAQPPAAAAGGRATPPVADAAVPVRVPPPVTALAGQARPSLVEALIAFREKRIYAEMPEADRSRGILRRQMLREIVRTHLDDPEDFHRKIPLSLRTATEGAQVKRYLAEICEIVSVYPPGQPLPD